MLWLYQCTEYLRSHLCNCTSAFVVGTHACKRCRGADTLQFTGNQPISYTSYQQRNVGSLATTVRMQFIKHQKLQHFGSKHSSLGRTRKNQFEHNIVREQ